MMKYVRRGNHLVMEDSCGCDATTSCGNTINSCTARPIQSNNLTYSGPNLSCSGIHTCDTITVAIQKLDKQLCDLLNIIYHLTTSTTTTECVGCLFQGNVNQI